MREDHHSTTERVFRGTSEAETELHEDVIQQVDPWLPPVRVPASLLEWGPHHKAIPYSQLGAPSPGPLPLSNTTVWRPTGLGIGLIFDWRLSSGPYTIPEQPQSNDLAAMFAELEPKGYHPVYLHAYVNDSQSHRLVANWLKDDDSSYQSKVVEGIDKTQALLLVSNIKNTPGWRAIGLASVYVQGDLRFSMVFIRDKGYHDTKWGVYFGRNRTQFYSDIGFFKGQNRRIISLSVSSDHEKLFSEPEYSYIWIQNDSSDMIGPDQWKIESLILPRSGKSIEDEVKANINKGWMPVCMDSYVGNLGGEFVTLYVNDQTGLSLNDWNINSSIDAASFGMIHSHRKYTHPTEQLVAFSTYTETFGQVMKMVAIWRKPLLRYFKNKRGTVVQSKLLVSTEYAVDVAVSDLMKSVDILGGEVTLFRKSEIVLEKAYTAGPKNLRHTEVNSAFRIASVSKPITAMAVLKALQNKIEQEGTTDNAFLDKLRMYLDSPAFSWAGMPSVEKHTYADLVKTISIRELLQHQCGWENTLRISGYSESYINDRAMQMLGEAEPYPPFTRKMLLDYLLNSDYWNDPANALDSTGFNFQRVASSPKQTYYSNVGYLLLCVLVEALSRTPYEVFVKNQILQPVDAFSTYLTNDARYLAQPHEVVHSAGSSYIGDNFGTLGGAATGRSILGSGAPSSSAPVTPYGTYKLLSLYEGAGAWVSTASDMVRILLGFRKYVINAKLPSQKQNGMIDVDGKSILRYETVTEMWSSPIVMIVSEGEVSLMEENSEGFSYRLGWISDYIPNGTEEEDVGGVSVRWHKGDYSGTYAAFAWLSDDRGFAFVFSRDRTKPVHGNLAGLGIYSTLMKIVRGLP